MENSLSSPIQQAAFLAASSQHSRDLLFALPTVSCGLRLDNKDVRIATGVRLCLQLCLLHRCHYGAQLDAHGRHSFVCKCAPGRTIRHNHLNELIARALSAASISNTKEPQGLSRSDGKLPDGLTLVSWQSGKPLIWEITLVCFLAYSCIASTAQDPSYTAEMVALNKTAKYAGLTTDYHFQPIFIETLRPANAAITV